MERFTLGPVDRFPDGRGVAVRVGDRSLAVFRVGEEVYALDDRCPHRGFPLNDGSIADGAVRCRTHGSCFDARSGEVRRGPSSRGVRAYAARIAEGVVVVEID